MRTFENPRTRAAPDPPAPVAVLIAAARPGVPLAAPPPRPRAAYVSAYPSTTSVRTNASATSTTCQTAPARENGFDARAVPSRPTYPDAMSRISRCVTRRRPPGSTATRAPTETRARALERASRRRASRRRATARRAVARARSTTSPDSVLPTDSSPYSATLEPVYRARRRRPRARARRRPRVDIDARASRRRAS